MGLFDNVHYRGTVYQTKDFEDPYMEHYRIEGGRLLKDQGHWEPPFPSEERKWVSDLPKDLNFHGVLNFYRYLDGHGVPATWEEYNMKFTDGQMVDEGKMPEEPQP